MADETTNTTSTGGNKMIVWVIVAVVLLAAGGFTLMSRNTSQPATESSDTTTAETNDSAMENEETATEDTAMAAGEIKVTGKNFSFDKKEIRVKKGEKVTLVFTSEGGTHDFVIDEFDVATKQLNSGQSETVEFTPTQTGTFEFYCSVGTHRAMGMKGKLVVE